MNRLSAKALRVYGKRKAVTKKALKARAEAVGKRLAVSHQAILAVFRDVFPNNSLLDYPVYAREEAADSVRAACRTVSGDDASLATTLLWLRQQLTDVAAKHTPVKHWAQR